MTKVYPYHSSNTSDPDVWHDHDDCPPGSRIPAQNKVQGKGPGNRYCEKCQQMN